MITKLNFKALNKKENTVDLSLASYMETQAEVYRQLGSSGVFSVRQYNNPIAFDNTTKVWDTSYSSLSIHNHPNYRGMAGCGEVSVMVNGYYIRTRHNDYRLYSPTGKNFRRKEILPPTGVNSVEYMRNVYENNPEDCIVYLSYVEVWLEKLSTDVGDRTTSFRHAVEAKNLKDALDNGILFNVTGHKNKRENIPYQPIIVRRVLENGDTQLAVVRYRISSHPVASLSNSAQKREIRYADGSTAVVDLASNPNITAKHGKGRKQWFYTKVLPKLCTKVPGLDGLDAAIQESYFDEKIGLDDVINTENAAFYNHSYTFNYADASGRTRAQRGFNDPNLFVAKTNNPKVLDSVSYMLPYELIIRTPREAWNPDNLPFVSKVSGKGTKEDPYTGVNINKYNYTIPVDTFADNTIVDPADTKKKAWVLGKEYYASGINVFDYDGHRKRYPIAPNYHDYSKASCDLSKLIKYLGIDENEIK